VSDRVLAETQRVTDMTRRDSQSDNFTVYFIRD